MREQAQGTIQTDNERTRVTLWEFPPQGETGFHLHEYDYVVVPMSTAPLAVVDTHGSETRPELVIGVSYFREAGARHNVINLSDTEISFIEIEFK